MYACVKVAQISSMLSLPVAGKDMSLPSFAQDMETTIHSHGLPPLVHLIADREEGLKDILQFKMETAQFTSKHMDEEQKTASEHYQFLNVHFALRFRSGRGWSAEHDRTANPKQNKYQRNLVAWPAQD